MASHSVDIDTLIRQVLPGDARLCEVLMGGYFDYVYNLAASFSFDPDECEDAAQEAIIYATWHIDRYQAGTNFKSWLVQITLNKCRDRYRHMKFRRRLLGLLQALTLRTNPHVFTPEDALIQGETRRTVRRAIDALDDKHRLPVLLRYEHQLTVPEIAHALDLSEGTVYSRLHYAHRKLREIFGSFKADAERRVEEDE